MYCVCYRRVVLRQLLALQDHWTPRLSLCLCLLYVFVFNVSLCRSVPPSLTAPLWRSVPLSRCHQPRMVLLQNKCGAQSYGSGVEILCASLRRASWHWRESRHTIDGHGHGQRLRHMHGGAVTRTNKVELDAVEAEEEAEGRDVTSSHQQCHRPDGAVHATSPIGPIGPIGTPSNHNPSSSSGRRPGHLTSLDLSQNPLRDAGCSVGKCSAREYANTTSLTPP